MGLHELKELKAKADQIERTTGMSGAIPNMPKQRLMDARDLQAQHPDKRIRWLNLRNPDKVAGRIAEGYVRISGDDGGRHLGDDYATFAIPVAEYNRRIAENERLGKERLKAYKTEFERTAESVARVLRDKHGIDVSAEDLLRE